MVKEISFLYQLSPELNDRLTWVSGTSIGILVSTGFGIQGEKGGNGKEG